METTLNFTLMSAAVIALPKHMGLAEDAKAVAYSQESVGLEAMKGRVWVVESGDNNYLYVGDTCWSAVPASLDTKRSFTAVVLTVEENSTLQFMQEGKEVGGAVDLEGKMELIKEKTVGGYSYTHILGAVILLAALTLGATYATGTFPFKSAAQKV